MGLQTNIWLVAGDSCIPVFTAYNLLCYTGTVHSITVSLHDIPLALESLLESLLHSPLESLLETLVRSLLGSLHERAALDNAMHWDE